MHINPAAAFISVIYLGGEYLANILVENVNLRRQCNVFVWSLSTIGPYGVHTDRHVTGSTYISLDLSRRTYQRRRGRGRGRVGRRAEVESGLRHHRPPQRRRVSASAASGARASRHAPDLRRTAGTDPRRRPTDRVLSVQLMFNPALTRLACCCRRAAQLLDLASTGVRLSVRPNPQLT